jgi:hypothetical protein
VADKAAYKQWQESARMAKSFAASDSLALWQEAHKVNQAYAWLALEGLQSQHGFLGPNRRKGSLVGVHQHFIRILTAGPARKTPLGAGHDP